MKEVWGGAGIKPRTLHFDTNGEGENLKLTLPISKPGT